MDVGLVWHRLLSGPQPKPRQSGFHGLRVEIFPAGTRRHVVWHPHRRLAGPDPEAPLGMVGLRDAAPAVDGAMRHACTGCAVPTASEAVGHQFRSP